MRGENAANRFIGKLLLSSDMGRTECPLAGLIIGVWYINRMEVTVIVAQSESGPTQFPLVISRQLH
jgi:hypothetical protein